MSQTYYRKYRPQLFAQVEGQEHVVRTLQGALLSGNPGHAYLFCGPRGTGKTTLARLFAKALNCEVRTAKQFEPCNQCSVCTAITAGNSLDLIEIDAASNRGIDEIRNLKEAARVAATGARYKIFIIDEAHMLTKDAFNALLKTLEEPPAHVLFVLATTEPHKLLETILSRVQRLDFKKIPSAQIIGKLQKLAQAETLAIEPAALGIVANYAGGSLRDAESALAKLVAYAGKTVTTEHAQTILGLVPIEIQTALLTAIAERNSTGALTQLANLYENGADLEHFAGQFVSYVRGELLTLVGQPLATTSVITPTFLVKVINTFVRARNELRHSPIPTLPLELAVLELTNG